MLVLFRRVGEEIVIGGSIRIVVKQVDGHRVRLGVIAPVSVPVYRSEILHNQGKEKREERARPPLTKQLG